MINTWLHGKLRRVFGEVKVANEGSPLIYQEFLNPITGKKNIQIQQRGETYCVNCPFCAIVTGGRPDTRFRLWINHCYGIKNHPSGRRFWGLAHCYNEDCLQSQEFRDALRSIVYGFESPPDATTLSRPLIDASPVELPSGLVPINSLPKSHQAVEYLLSRGYDPDYLYEVFQVQYAAESDPRFPAMYERIIIPIYVKGTLLGFQGRAVGNNEPLRYITARGTKTANSLYGYDVFPKMEGARIAFLVEGPADVWRLGPGSLAMLGTHLSQQKTELLRELNTDLVFVLLDGDIGSNPHGMSIVDGIHFRLERAGIRHIIRLLPGNTDPSDFGKEQLYEFISSEVRAALEAGCLR